MMVINVVNWLAMFDDFKDMIVGIARLGSWGFGRFKSALFILPKKEHSLDIDHPWVIYNPSRAINMYDAPMCHMHIFILLVIRVHLSFSRVAHSTCDAKSGEIWSGNPAIASTALKPSPSIALLPASEFA